MNFSQIKRAFAELLLEEHGRVMVVVQADREDVVLPQHLEGLQILDLWPTAPVPIDNLELTDEGFSATLSFNRTPFHCSATWKAVAMIGHSAGDRSLSDHSAVEDAGDRTAADDDSDKPKLRVVR